MRESTAAVAACLLRPYSTAYLQDYREYHVVFGCDCFNTPLGRMAEAIHTANKTAKRSGPQVTDGTRSCQNDHRHI